MTIMTKLSLTSSKKKIIKVNEKSQFTTITIINTGFGV